MRFAEDGQVSACIVKLLCWRRSGKCRADNGSGGAPDPLPPPQARRCTTVDVSLAPSWLHRPYPSEAYCTADKPCCVHFSNSVCVRACLYIGHHPSPSWVPNSELADLGAEHGTTCTDHSVPTYLRNKGMQLKAMGGCIACEYHVNLIFEHLRLWNGHCMGCWADTAMAGW